MAEDKAASVPPPSKKPSKKKRKKDTSWFDPKTVRQAADILNVGLRVLEGHKTARPYAQAIRTVTTLGVEGLDALNPTKSSMLDRVRVTRQNIRQLEAEKPQTRETKQTIKLLRDQLDVYIDLFLEEDEHK